MFLAVYLLSNMFNNGNTVNYGNKMEIAKNNNWTRCNR